NVPDICVDLAVDVLQLVQILDRPLALGHADLAVNPKRLRIEEFQGGRAVAHDQVPAIVSQPPALPAVADAAKSSERLPIVDKSGLVLPGKLIDPILEDG